MESIQAFRDHLIIEEKSEATREKYLRDVVSFLSYLKDRPLIKEELISYKRMLIEEGYAPVSINSMLAGINSYLSFLKRDDIKVKNLKIQKQVFCHKKKELSKDEYQRLCLVARKKKNKKLYYILQTICSTGIRVSELSYITVEAVRKGEAVVSCKSKIRKIFLVKKLQRELLKYIDSNNIESGPIFLSKTGIPINRVSIWKQMKALCEQANVDPDKVYPHNLRHLFARLFYRVKMDIAALADVLGHSNISTTRIYIASSGEEHRSYLENLKLII